MKKLLSLVLLVPMFMNAQGVRFEEKLTWKQLLKKAKEENKYIFVDCYATWCGPCKWMDKSVYSQEKVGDYFNDKFISMKVQMDTSKSDNDFTKEWYTDAGMIKSLYKVNAFPTYLFFSPDGNIVHKETGAQWPDNFITIGTDALDVNKQYYVLLERYRRNELDTALMKYLARKAKDVDGDEVAHRIANDYINQLPSNALFTKDNIRMMYEFTKSSKDKGFVIFRDSAKRISETDERVKVDVCRNIVLDIIYGEEIKPYRFTKNGKPDWKRIKMNLKKYGLLGDEAFIKHKPGIIFKTEIEPALKINPDWTKILLLIEKQKLGKNSEFVVGSTVVYYLNAILNYHTEKNCKNLIAAAKYYADSFPTFLSARALNTWAYTLFENSNDKDELNQALEWSKRSNELETESPESLDTYASLLYKLGRVQEAIVWQEKAVRIEEGKTKRQDFKKTLEKMQKGEKTWP